MGKVVVDLTVSLDGFIAGSDDGPDLPLGRGGERLFTWMNAGPESNRVDRWLAPPDGSKVVVDEWMTQGRRDHQRPSHVRHRRRVEGRSSDRRADLRHHPRGADAR
jgi:hypothetical protein